MATEIPWTQIPIGAAVAVLLLREVFRFLKERNGHGGSSTPTAGDKSTEYWETSFREIVFTELDRHVMPCLRDLQERQKRIIDTAIEIRFRLRERRGGGENSD